MTDNALARIAELEQQLRDRTAERDTALEKIKHLRLALDRAEERGSDSDMGTPLTSRVSR